MPPTAALLISRQSTMSDRDGSVGSPPSRYLSCLAAASVFARRLTNPGAGSRCPVLVLEFVALRSDGFLFRGGTAGGSWFSNSRHRDASAAP